MSETGKILYLVRHAKSSWSGTERNDFDRPLNDRGLRDAPDIGRRLRLHGTLPALIICSPALRARQTLEQMALGVEPVRFDERIYCASAGDLLAVVQSAPDTCSPLMLIGHNPAMSLLTARLSGLPIHDMPTGAVATIGLRTDRWRAAGSCPAELLRFDYPKKADP